MFQRFVFLAAVVKAVDTEMDFDSCFIHTSSDGIRKGV